MNDSIQQQARALGDPTRHRIFRHLAETMAPMDVSELTDLLGLNHNAIRQHLAKLVDAGLVVQRTAAARGRGRPRLLFEIDPSADERWGAAGAYQRLSLLLVEMLRSGDDAIEVGRRAGVAAQPASVEEDPVAALERAIAAGGFEPTLVSDEEGVEFVLQRCPFADAAIADPDLVCSLHLGMAQGLAQHVDGVVVDELEPHHPHHAGCRLRFHLEKA